MVYHLGILHFLPTFSLANYYLVVQIVQGNIWLGILGFCLIMFAGVGIDSDHYMGKKARARRKEILAGLMQGKLTLGTCDPTKVNFFHTPIGLLCMSAVGLLIMHTQILLGGLFLAAYLIHMLFVDPLDCDNQRVPTNPLSTAIHIFFWNRSILFQKLCFNKKVLSQI